MAGAFLAGGSAALIAAFTAISLPEAETVSDPQGRSAAEDGSRATILLRDAKPPLRSKIIARSAINKNLVAAAENSCPAPFQTGSGRRLLGV
jgi:hypothetical protein